ncbi:sensor domain-containing phosphodiesterase [Salinicola socius]|uniref:Sensor domain-containing phosphodiesterase n=1 Tax=Salinicola socius TaxID=404433 RepID=A0A1Q8SVG0_9GAMM|nr:GGDEF and EAL domain-containing protein [Salinicola socius]OLO05420.1 sensor domain-containing phosphodiesterase [Salinicola socius]
MINGSHISSVEEHERKRLSKLRQLNLLDTPPSESFDRITRIASELFNLPIAAVSLTDENRQWFKSRVGIDHWEIPRSKACCGEVADLSRVVVIPDLLESPHYRDSPLAQSGIRFYAGAPLQTYDGYLLGAMCVLGNEPRSVTEHEISMLKDLAAMVMAQIELQHAFGRLDPLTGLSNSSKFIEDLEDRARDRAGVSCFALYIELIDIAEMHSLQRVLGPACLDDVAREAAMRLQLELGVGNVIYQVGPCQYAYILESAERCLEESEALATALRLRQVLSSMPLGDAVPFVLCPMVGVAPFRLGENVPADILRTSHSACQAARDSETGVSLFSSSLDEQHFRRFELINGFRHALEDVGQLQLVYQPRVSLATGRCVGAEALIRWQHPTLGSISPDEFISLIEHTAMVRPLTDWVLRHAIRQAAVWHRRGRVLQMSVNISAANLGEPDFSARLERYLAEQALPVGALELELTESALISNTRTAREALDVLVNAGIRLAIDDFGTGYSSLAYLQKVPADVVKIDRSFVAQIDQQARSQTLIKAMISMAQELGYHVVAEGVETQESYRILQALGCDEAQGYWMGRPMTAEAFDDWLAAR